MTKEDKKRKELIQQAYDYEQEAEYATWKMRETLEEIQKLKPTKKELKEGLQDLLDCL